MKTLAAELFKEFRETSVSEFFRKNAAMLGYTGKIRSLTTVVHEGVTNAIDAAEESGVLPDIRVEINKVNEDPEHFKVVIQDNASGIPEEFIPDVFGKMLAGTKLHRNMQSRGQQGIGIVGSVMFGQITSGKPSTIYTAVVPGEIVRAEVMIDLDKNEGKIVNRGLHPNAALPESLNGDWQGTRVEIELKDVAYVRSRYGPFNYLRMTAIANPHARIEFFEPDGTRTTFEPATDKVPDRPKPTPPHPWGITSDDLLILAKHAKSRTIAGFMVAELSRMTKAKVEEIRRNSGVNLDKKPSEMTWEDAEKIVSTFKQHSFSLPLELKQELQQKQVSKYSFSLPLELKQELQQKQVSEKLREIFKQHRYALSEEAKIQPINSDEWKVLDGKKEYTIKEESKQLNIYISKKLRKKRVSKKLREKFEACGYALSEEAKIQPINSDEWKVLDGKKEYTIKEDNKQLNINLIQIKFMGPPTEGLRPIGAADIEKGICQILKPEFAYAVTRSPKVYRGGIPFIVEAGIAYGGSAGKVASAENTEDETEGLELIRFANRAPLIFDQGGCAITAAARSIDWQGNYKVDISTTPLTLFVNVVSAYVPYTSAGKQSIAEESEVYGETRSAIMDVARELKRHLQGKIREKERQQRAGVFEQYLPIINRKAAKMAGVKEPDIKPLLKKVAGVENAES